MPLSPPPAAKLAQVNVSHRFESLELASIPQSFEAEYIEAMAKEAGVPSADVVIVSILPGSVVVVAEVEFRGEVEMQHVDSFVETLENNSSSIFDANFTSKYGPSTVLNVSTEYEPSSPPPPSPPPLPSPSPSSDSDDNASTAGIGVGAIIGIVVGVFAVVMCSVLGYFAYMRKDSAAPDSTQMGLLDTQDLSSPTASPSPAGLQSNFIIGTNASRTINPIFMAQSPSPQRDDSNIYNL